MAPFDGQIIGPSGRLVPTLLCSIPQECHIKVMLIKIMLLNANKNAVILREYNLQLKLTAAANMAGKSGD